MSGLRERKKQATRIAIRDAAMALFAEHGFAHTTFDRIAEAADVSRATVFSYFPTKEEIVFGDAGAAVDALAATLAARPAGQSTIATVRTWLGARRASRRARRRPPRRRRRRSPPWSGSS